MGLALGYAGTEREEFIENIIPFIIDTNFKVEVNAMASLMLGLNFVSCRNEEVANAVL
jgi:26S proteasome regulatory subunit N1